jgi:hypothetical protein
LGPFFMLCAPRLIFAGTKSVGFCFSCFVLPDSFSAVPNASGPVFISCPPGLIFGGDEGIGPRILVLRARTHFRLYRGRRVLFSYFASPNSCSTVPRASGLIFMFCARRVVFGGTVRVGSCFHILRARTHFRRYRGRRVPFSCFALTDSFSAVSMALGPFLMFCASELVFGGIECVWSRFHILPARTRFRRYRGRRVPFFMFCAPGLVFGGVECVGSSIHV